jgi:hypothetical protein
MTNALLVRQPLCAIPAKEWRLLIRHQRARAVRLPIFTVSYVRWCAKGAPRNDGFSDGKRSGIRTYPMPVRGKLGTSWAQFRHNLGTNELSFC